MSWLIDHHKKFAFSGKISRAIFVCSFFLFCINQSHAQTNILDKVIEIRFQENSVSGHVENLLIHHNLSIGFNSSRVDLSTIVRLPQREMKVSDIIRQIFYVYDYELTVQGNKILISFEEIVENVRLRGFVKDAYTGEILAGAIVHDLNSGSSTFSSERGFYSISVPLKHNLEVSYLGYGSTNIENVEDGQYDIYLTYDNQLSEIVIRESVSDNFIEGIGSERIILNKIAGYSHVSGENDVLANIKIRPSVQSGNEAQTGMYVRGGSDDQNLILFEGIPLYEVSHVAGLSNMFIEESIHSVDFIANGFPARYGGRLSSVTNVQLKEGNKSEIQGTVSASLPSAKLHLEGPILSDKTTFNVAVRRSYIDSYLDKLIGDIIDFDIDVDYNDFVGKINHRFNPSQSLSLSYHQGNDNLTFDRNIIEEAGDRLFETIAQNDIKRNNRVWSLNFKNVLSDKGLLDVYVGGVNYNLSTRGFVDARSTISGLEEISILEVISFSSIDDVLANFNFDYYLNDKHRLKFGGGWINHRYKPDVRSGTILQEGVLDSLNNSNEFQVADELSLYLEDTFKPNDNWEIYAGVHLSRYIRGAESFGNLQPRVNVIYKPAKFDRFTVSFATMYQYIHQLVNPSIGLPSNFWTPSSSLLLPSRSDQFSVSYDRQFPDGWTVHVGGYYKWLSNLVDYQSTSDLFVIGGGDDVPGLEGIGNFEDRITTGNGTSKGLEFSVNKTSGAISGWISYALSKADRQFSDINDGEVFPYTFDRRHDVNIGTKYTINDAFNITASWVYGSGNSFSLALEEFSGGSGVETFVNGGERNNHRFQPYHVLNFQLNYLRKMKRGLFSASFGVNNAYNRRNIYYIYIFENPLSGLEDVRQTTLFPILPSVNIEYSF